MPTLASRRRPWPYDMRFGLTPSITIHHLIGDYRGQTIGSLRPKTIGQLRGASNTSATPTHGLVLIPNQTTGLLVGRKQHNLGENLPPQAAYDSAPIYREHTFEFRPIGGMGESVQSSRTDRRYHYAINCWMTGGLFGPGPKTHPIVPTQTGSIRGFAEALNAGTLSLFILAGANVLLRNDDTNAGQVVSRNRAGHVATDAVRFTGAYASPVDGLYVAWDDGVLEEYNGTTWTPCVLPSGFSPQFVCRLGDELWAADPTHCHLRKCTNDPKVAGSWSGPILVGTPSIPITALRQTTNRLVIFKADGDVFTINGDGSDNDLYPGLENTVDLSNGRTAAAWQGSLWFRAGRAFWRLDMQGGAVLTPEGPGRQLANLSEVRGPVQAFAGWNSQLAFGIIYNASLNNSYLLSYGNWVPVQGDQGTQYTFTNQWDGALVRYQGRKATCLNVSMIPYDARLYIGFEDGGYDWIKLVTFPLIPNSGAEFTTDESYIVTPLHTDMFQADLKHVIGFSVFGPYFPNTGASVQIDYRLHGAAGMPPSSPPPTNDFLPLGIPFTRSGQRNDMTGPVAAMGLDVKVNFVVSSSDVPILEGAGIHERLVPTFRRDFTFSIDARDATARRDGAAVRQSGRFLRDLVMSAAAAPAEIQMQFPDEEVLNVALFDYAEREVAHSAFGGQAWAIDCQATQFTVATVYGTIGRTRGTLIGDTRGWPISQMRYF